MKIFSKIIMRILVILLLFVFVNLVIGFTKHKSLADYTKFLNERDRNYSVSQISIKNPISILSLFYGEISNQDLSWNVLDMEGENLDEDIALDWNILPDDGLTTIDPYDPEFEDDFNEFFGKTKIEWSTGDESYENPWFVAPDEGFIVGDADWDEPSVAQQLLDRINQ